jgi:NADH:ubiquinone reductase (H+-translocating)
MKPLISSRSRYNIPKTETILSHANRIIIIGGGFGGLYCARSLRKAPLVVTLIDRRNFHLFQPLLYQVATGGLSPANIAAPLRAVLERQKNTEVLLGDVCGFDLAGRRVLLADQSYAYDSLVVATGSETSYFGHDAWEPAAPGLKTIEEATEIRHRVLMAFEAAEREHDPDKVRRLLTFVIVGGGPTGVEMAGAVAEMARHTLRGEFRHIDPSQARVFLVEGGDRVLQAFSPRLSGRARTQLEQLGVIVRLNALVTDVREEGVTICAGQQTEEIATTTMVWAAGVRASPLGKVLAEAAGIQVDRQGRVPVEGDLSLPGHPEVFVIGDLACVPAVPGGPSLPGLAPVAMQQGHYVAKLIGRRLRGQASRPFRYWDKGTMATIGRARAVAAVGPIGISGLLAWLAWLFIHLMYIVEFQNRLLIFFQWAWSYLTWNRSARLITGVRRRATTETRSVSVGKD